MATSKTALVAIVVVVVIVAGLAAYYLTLPTAPPLRSVKIALLYDPTVPILKAQGEAAKVAIEEINAAGGILGTKIEYREWNTMKKVDVALAAYREAVVDWGAQYVILEGVSEEMLALMEEGAKLYPRYPHILTYVGAATEVSVRIINEYDKYKFAFRMFWGEHDGFQVIYPSFFWEAKNVFGVKKIAILIEDAAYTRGVRERVRIETKHGVIETKTLRDLAEEIGLEVVYEAHYPVGEKNFLPYLEAAYAKGAECIFALTSWYTDCVALVKQWATSIARDLYLNLFGGPNQWTIFWDLTGGAALGVLSSVADVEDYPPISPYTQSFIKKMHEKGLRVDMSAHYCYSIVYHIKEAIEYVAEQGKDPNNIDEVIKALETVPCSVHTLLPKEVAIFGSKERGRFHSYPAPIWPILQFQGKDKIIIVGHGAANPYFAPYYPRDILEKYFDYNPPKRPAELRKG